MARPTEDPREEQERDRNPHRREEQRHARDVIAGQLHRRRIEVLDSDPMEAISDLLIEVERFEGLVQARGGDLFVNQPGSDRPERPEYVLPERKKKEDIASYTRRVREAADRIGRAD